MKNSKLRRALLLLACAVMLVSLSVGATLAYLMDDDEVKNTFTVGEVYIELDETDKDGSNTNPNEGANHTGRDKENTYHIVPHATFDKDPIVWVKETSDKAYLFIKVTNEIAGIEANAEGRDTIHVQIQNSGWTELEASGDTTVYYQLYDPATLSKENVNAYEAPDWKFATFTHVYIADDLNSDDIAAYKDKTIVVHAYAIQYAGFENKPADAWTALNAQINAEASGT